MSNPLIIDAAKFRRDEYLSKHKISQYASGPDSKAHCHAQLAVSSPAVSETIASTPVMGNCKN